MRAPELFEPVKTCHAMPWALVKRGGAVPMQRPRTRLAYLTGTYRPKGVTVATAMKGYLLRLDRHGRLWRETRRPVVIPWGDVVERWGSAPTPQRIARSKKRIPIAGLEVVS